MAYLRTLFSELDQLFIDAEKAPNIKEKIEEAEKKFLSIVELEKKPLNILMITCRELEISTILVGSRGFEPPTSTRWKF